MQGIEGGIYCRSCWPAASSNDPPKYWCPPPSNQNPTLERNTSPFSPVHSITPSVAVTVAPPPTGKDTAASGTQSRNCMRSCNLQLHLLHPPPPMGRLPPRHGDGGGDYDSSSSSSSSSSLTPSRVFLRKMAKQVCKQLPPAPPPSTAFRLNLHTPSVGTRDPRGRT